MNSYYSPTSFIVELPSKEATIWAQQVSDAVVNRATSRLKELVEDIDEETLSLVEDNVDLVAEVQGNSWLFACEYNAAYDIITSILEKFIKEFAPDSYITFCFADTCSSLEPDAFGGGMFLIHKDGSHVIEVKSLELDTRELMDTGLPDGTTIYDHVVLPVLLNEDKSCYLCEDVGELYRADGSTVECPICKVRSIP